MNYVSGGRRKRLWDPRQMAIFLRIAGDLTSKLQSSRWMQSLEFITYEKNPFWKMQGNGSSNQMKSIAGCENH